MSDRIEKHKKVHIGSFLIALGTILLFTGSGAALGIADNYVPFLIAIICNLVEAILRQTFKIKISIGNVFLILITIMTLLYMIAGKYDRGSALSMAMFTILLLSIELVGYNESDFNVIIFGVIVSSVVFSLLIVFSGHEYLYQGTAKFTYTQSFASHITFEPNYLGAIIVMGFCLCIHMSMRQNIKTIEKILCFFLAIVDLIGIMLTGSRSALIAAILFGVILLFTMKRGKAKRRMIILIGLLVVLLCIFIAIKIVPERIYLRMFEASYLDNSNMKRLSDWSYGFKSMMKGWLIGHGPLPTSRILLSDYGFYGDVHNTFLSLGVMFGFFPFLLFLLWNIRLSIDLYRYGYRILFAAFISMLLEWNILACQFSVVTWLMIIIVMITQNIESGICSSEKGDLEKTIYPHIANTKQ